MASQNDPVANGNTHVNSEEQNPSGSIDTSVPIESRPNWVPLLEQPAYTRRPLKIICVGAGYSGLTLAHKIKHEYKISDVIDLTIYEKNAEVGGTWLENRYPGIACDAPAHIYTFVFEPNPDWSQLFASGQEIQEYIKRTVRKWDLDERVQFNSRIIETTWDEDSGKWRVKVEQNGVVKEDEADILINGAGFLNKWKWPTIEGLWDFKGKLVHTARWDESYDWENKKVAVIGNGSSGIQCVPAMQPKVSKIVNYIRTPTWISIDFNPSDSKKGNFAYSEEEKQLFRENPDHHFAYRKRVEATLNSFFFGMRKNHPMQLWLTDACKTLTLERLKGSPDLSPEHFLPDFHPGCRRLSPGDGYIEAFSNANCTMESTPIERITERGIKTVDGKEEEFDLIVCATGFDTTFIPSWKLVGRNGVTLNERWKKDAQAFFAVQVDGMPNYFMFNGPNCPISHGSILTQISWTCDYILRLAKKIATEDIKSLDVLPGAVADYNVWSQEALKRTVWADKCRSWYKNGKETGWITAPYAASILHFKDCLENIGAEHFDIRYRSANRFRFLGNATSIADKDGAGDMAYYMDGFWEKYGW